MVDQDYMSVTMKLAPTRQIYDYVSEVERINSDIELEEERIRGELSMKISENADVLTRNCERMGSLGSCAGQSYIFHKTRSREA